MKQDKLFRLSAQAQKAVDQFKEEQSIKEDREALERLIKDAWHTRVYLRYVLEHRDATKEEPECIRRILYAGSFFCAKNAPRIVELPTLDICKACKFKAVLGWAKHPSVSTAPSLMSPDTAEPRIKEVYCNSSGGLYVTQGVCNNCNNPCEKKALFT
jgi:hypothetical protein